MDKFNSVVMTHHTAPDTAGRPVVENIPQELGTRPQFLVWRSEKRNASDKKPTKVPYDAKTGRHAKTSDRSTWSTFDEAVETYSRGGYSGIGFVFSQDDPYFGVDLDDCRDPETGELDERAQRILQDFDGAYVEVSPSGTGVKFIGKGSLPTDKTGGKQDSIEMYHFRRYFALTGQQIGDNTDIADCQGAAEKLYRSAIEKRHDKNGDTTPPRPTKQQTGQRTANVVDRGRKYIAKMPSAISGQGGHDRTFAAACALVIGFDLDADDAYTLLAEYNQRCQPPWSEAELRHKIESAGQQQDQRGNLLNAPNDRRKNGGSDGGQIKIVIKPDELRVTDEAIAALTDCDNVYQRGGRLVQCVREVRPPKDIIRPAGVLSIHRIEQPTLRERMAAAAIWQRVKGVKGESEVAVCHPPDWAVKAVYSRGRWDGIPPIEGIIESPVIRPDGSVIQTDGYDQQTGLFFSPRTAFPDVPAEPTRDEARKAAADLMEVVADFPFMKPEHRAAWLAAAITPAARYAISGPCPLVAIDANVRASGKSLCADAISMIHTGRTMARIAPPCGDEEMRKKITSIALAGERMVLIDNVVRMFGCASLDAALTGTTWNDRLMMTNQMTGELTLNTLWFCTGNNMVFAADTARRALHIRLESPEENPEERTGFEHPDLLKWIKSRRPRLATAATTLLRGYFAADGPDMELKPWGSFEEWSRIVRQAVVWVGFPDPGDTRQELAEQSDHDANVLRQLLVGWEEMDPDHGGLTVAEVLRALDEFPDKFNALRNAITEITPAGKPPNARSIGMRLHHLRQRVSSGKYFERGSGKDGATWKVSFANSGGD